MSAPPAGPAIHLTAFIAYCRWPRGDRAQTAARQGGWMIGSSGVVSAVGAAKADFFFSMLAGSFDVGHSSRRFCSALIIGWAAGREFYGAQLSDAAATTVVEVRRAEGPGPRHGILPEHDHQCLRQQCLRLGSGERRRQGDGRRFHHHNGARPGPSFDKIGVEIDQLHAFGDFPLQHRVACLRSELPKLRV